MRDGFREISAGAVVLGCGGFEANPEWRARYLGRPWDHAKVRGTRYNTGDGLRMALEIGALPCGQWTGCHSTPDRRRRAALRRPQAHRQDQPPVVSVRRARQRRTAGASSTRARTSSSTRTPSWAASSSTRPAGVGYQIFDAKVTRPARGALQDRAAGRRGHARRAGRAAPGGSGAGAWRRSTTYNAAVGSGAFDPTVRDGLATRGLALPKSNWAQRLDTPPFTAWPVTGGITFTFGGVRVNEHAQVHRARAGRPSPGSTRAARWSAGSSTATTRAGRA